MEELAFGEPENTSLEPTEDHAKVFTNRELVALVQEAQCHPFAVLETLQGANELTLGQQQRPGNIIFVIVNIIRNLTIFTDNVEFISNHPRLVDMLLRLCTIKRTPGDVPAPASKALSLSDLLLIRRDVVNVLMGIAGSINLSQNPSSPKALRLARRAFDLLASYLVDPIDAVPPLASVQLAGIAPSPNRKPPVLTDTALEVFARFTQTDANRQIITKAVPTSSLWLLLENLVHRLPLVDADFILMQREYWLCFVEKTVMAIYSLVFLSPQELKQKIKTDRSLGFKNVMLRMAQRILTMPTDGRLVFVVPARRAIETMKLLDKSEDLVDTSEPETPILSFGMGFSDSGDAGMEKGTGMLGGNREIAWDMLMTRDVFQDDIFFNELDSMVRVECQ
jgi:SWI/SNF chromatin-remodeling complex subunit SWI1